MIRLGRLTVITKRAFLLGGYIILSTLLILATYNPQGDAGREPAVLLTSWAFFLYAQLYHWGTLDGMAASWHYVLFYIILIGYLTVLCLITSLLERTGKLPGRVQSLPSLLVPIVIHFGVLWIVFSDLGFMRRAYADKPLGIYIVAAASAFALALVYRYIDWRLATGRKKLPTDKHVNRVEIKAY